MNINPIKRTVALLVLGFVMPAIFQSTPVKSELRAAPSTVRQAEVVKVGITEYQNVEDSYDRYENLFQQLSKAASPNEPVTFSFAIGNYGEVLDWYNNGLIDVAILSAMPVADLLNNAGPEELKKIDEAYVGDVSVSRLPSDSKRTVMDLFPVLQRAEPFKYRAGCIVLDSDKDIRTIEDIKRFWQQDQVRFLFVRPYSMSGYVLPMSALHKHGIYPHPGQFKFTYEHSKSLAEMGKRLQDQNSSDKKHLVAFVLDGTAYEPPKGVPPHIFSRVGIPELDAHSIPREIVLANYHQEKDKLESGYSASDAPAPNDNSAGPGPANQIHPANKFQKYKALMTRLFKNWRAPRPGMQTNVLVPDFAKSDISIDLRPRSDNWQNDYRTCQEAIGDIQLPRDLLYRSTLDDLLNDLARDIDRGGSPRLALVLSGGGAKCSYQAGAVVEIENKIKEINSKRGPQRLPLRIDLVVGTSGGAINALLASLGVTTAANGADEMERMWSSFKQQEFLQPSHRFNLVFGLCFGLLQALLITVAVLLFGRQSMNWTATLLVLVLVAVVEIIVCTYFGVRWRSITWVLGAEGTVVAFIIATVLIVGFLIDVIGRWWWRRKHLVEAETPPVGEEEGVTSLRFERNLQHWRWLTIVLMLTFSMLEVLIAKVSGLDAQVSRLSSSHWIDHIWMLVTLICNWSFPYPLAIALLMTLIGGVIWGTFDWNQRRETFVWWMTIILIAVSAGLLLEVLFRENAPSKAQGIEDAFAQNIPDLIRRTVKPDFKPSAAREGESPLQAISRQLMDENTPMLQRDLMITTSRLPINANAAEGIDEDDAQLVNNLPDDLYFYFRHNKDDELKPPLDKRLIPFKRNPDKLLDVVIGSSTIYPIFPSRVLEKVSLGNEEVQAPKTIKKMRIIDGGFIHNIPIEAAGLWKASHIILIEASPLQPQSEPRNLWDNAMMAFGYLFSQAQRSDKLAKGGAEIFELRPTSRCEKLGTLPFCTGEPEPDMDTFDFSSELVRNAYQRGRDDVQGRVQGSEYPGSETPLFIRVPGPPLFRNLSPVSVRYFF